MTRKGKTPLTTKPIEKTAIKAKVELLYLFILFCLTAFVFSSSIKNGFVWDDMEYIVNNSHITSLSMHSIYSMFTTFYSANYHPLTTLSWAIEYHFFSLNAAVYHSTNIVIHILNIGLVYVFVKALTKKINISILTAAVFAIHPLHVESVVWISERKDLLYTFFYLAGISVYLLYLEKKQLKYLFLTFVLFLLSCFSKSAAITLPLILLLLDYYKNNFSIKSIIQKIPFLLLSITFGILAILSQKAVSAVNLDVLKYSLFDRCLMLLYSVYYYLSSFIIPGKLCLIHYYPKSTSIPFIYYVVPFILATIVGAMLYFKKYRKEFIFGLMFYAITISLVIQLIPLGKGMVSERYSYVPYIGISIMFFSILLNEIETRKNEKRNKTILFVLIGIIFMLFSFQSRNRINDWKSGETLMSDVINKNPNESFGYYLRCYYRIGDLDYQGCISDCNNSLLLDSNSTIVYLNRAVAKFYLADYKGAIVDNTHYLAVDQNSDLAFKNRGRAKYALQDYSGAVSDYNESIKRNPNLTDIYLDLSNAQIGTTDYDGALESCNKFINWFPQNDNGYYNKGNCYIYMKQYNKAIECYNIALQINPRLDVALCNRGYAKEMLNDKKAAYSDYKLSMDLGNATARNNIERCK
jgi:hypothetical protein